MSGPSEPIPFSARQQDDIDRHAPRVVSGSSSPLVAATLALGQAA